MGTFKISLKKVEKTALFVEFTADDGTISTWMGDVPKLLNGDITNGSLLLPKGDGFVLMPDGKTKVKLP